MNEFPIWFGTGLSHILDPGGYDHILYVTLLALSFPAGEWRKLLLIVTAFTAGHSISLALSVTGVLGMPQGIVEFLIALSILVTALYQLPFKRNRQDAGNLQQYQERKQGDLFYYAVTFFFGLVHGLGFSFLLKSMLGATGSVFLPLLYFNLGLELGQLIIISVILLFSLFLSFLFKWPYKFFKLTLLCIIITAALFLSAERLWSLR